MFNLISKAIEISPGLFALMLLFFISIWSTFNKKTKTLFDIISQIILTFLIIAAFVFQIKANVKNFFTIQELKIRITCLEKTLKSKNIYNKSNKECKMLKNMYSKINKQIDNN